MSPLESETPGRASFPFLVGGVEAYVLDSNICTPCECRYQVSDSGEITSTDLVARFGYSGRIGKISNSGVPIYSAYFKSWLWSKQQGRCGYCGEALTPGRGGQIDHIIPQSAGGSHLPPNLMYSCGPCNAGKCNRGIPEVRHMIRVRLSPVFGIISPKQVLMLEAIGIDLRLPVTPEFLCETEAWTHVELPAEVCQ